MKCGCEGVNAHKKIKWPGPVVGNALQLLSTGENLRHECTRDCIKKEINRSWPP